MFLSAGMNVQINHGSVIMSHFYFLKKEPAKVLRVRSWHLNRIHLSLGRKPIPGNTCQLGSLNKGRSSSFQITLYRSCFDPNAFDICKLYPGLLHRLYFSIHFNERVAAAEENVPHLGFL